MRNRPILAAAAALLLAVIACGPLAGSTEEVFEEIEAELDSAADGGETTSEDTSEEPADIPSFEYTGLDYENFDSYEIDIVITFAANDGSGSLDMNINLIEQQEPRIAQFLIDVSGEGDGDVFDLGLEGNSGRIGLYEVDGVSYVEFSDDSSEPFCFGSPTDPEDETESPAGDFVGEGGAFDLSDVDADWEAIGTEEVNGIATYHYRAEDFQDEDLTEAVADIWVSQEDGNIIRLTLEGVGTLDDSVGEGNVSLSYNLVSINEPVEVTVPDYCETFDIPEGDEGGTDS